MKTNPLAAVDIYCKFPMKPVKEQTFEDAFITGEIVRILMKQEMYDHPKLASNMIDYGKVMGTGRNYFSFKFELQKICFTYLLNVFTN